jgi:glycosyltransferase involved in cell wall biosynthesis
MSAAVVVPARDAAATLPRTLDALAAQDVTAELIVVDDGSRDGTAELAEDHPAVTRVVRRPRTEGPGAARNAGARATSASFLAFTDADCAPTAGWLSAGLRALQDADLVQGAVQPDPGAARHPHDRTIAVSGPTPLFETASLFVRRDLFDRLGGFPDGIADPRKHLAEDVFFGWAARRAGARIVFATDAVVHHAVFARSTRAYLGERARLRHFPAIVAAVPELRGAALHHRLFLTARSRDFDLALAGVAAAAFVRRPQPLAAAAPYVHRLYRHARSWPGHPLLATAAGAAAADGVSALALLAGSVRARTLVL